MSRSRSCARASSPERPPKAEVGYEDEDEEDAEERSMAEERPLMEFVSCDHGKRLVLVLNDKNIKQEHDWKDLLSSIKKICSDFVLHSSSIKTCLCDKPPFQVEETWRNRCTWKEDGANDVEYWRFVRFPPGMGSEGRDLCAMTYWCQKEQGEKWAALGLVLAACAETPKLIKNMRNHNTLLGKLAEEALSLRRSFEQGLSAPAPQPAAVPVAVPVAVPTAAPTLAPQPSAAPEAQLSQEAGGGSQSAYDRLMSQMRDVFSDEEEEQRDSSPDAAAAAALPVPPAPEGPSLPASRQQERSRRGGKRAKVVKEEEEAEPDEVESTIVQELRNELARQASELSQQTMRANAAEQQQKTENTAYEKVVLELKLKQAELDMQTAESKRIKDEHSNEEVKYNEEVIGLFHDLQAEEDRSRALQTEFSGSLRAERDRSTTLQTEVDASISELDAKVKEHAQLRVELQEAQARLLQEAFEHEEYKKSEAARRSEDQEDFEKRKKILINSEMKAIRKLEEQETEAKNEAKAMKGRLAEEEVVVKQQRTTGNTIVAKMKTSEEEAARYKSELESAEARSLDVEHRAQQRLQQAGATASAGSLDLMQRAALSRSSWDNDAKVYMDFAREADLLKQKSGRTQTIFTRVEKKPFGFIYIGTCASTKHVLQNLNVNYVLTLDEFPKPLPRQRDGSTKEQVCIPMEDAPTQDILQHLDQAHKFLTRVEAANGRVLVTSPHGVNRAGAIVVSFMMKRLVLQNEIRKLQWGTEALTKALTVLRDNWWPVLEQASFRLQLLQWAQAGFDTRKAKESPICAPLIFRAATYHGLQKRVPVPEGEEAQRAKLIPWVDSFMEKVVNRGKDKPAEAVFALTKNEEKDKFYTSLEDFIKTAQRPRGSR